MPEGTAIERTSEAAREVETWLRAQHESRIVTTYVGQSAPRFYIPLSPELPDPSFAKIIVRTEKEADRDALKLRLRQAVANGLAPSARVPTIAVHGDIADGLQPPDVSTALLAKLQPIIQSLPQGYHIDMAGSIEEAGKANAALAPIFPLMIVLMMIVIILQVRNLKAMLIVLPTAPLGLIGVVPTLLLTGTPFRFNAILGLIALAGILMRNTLILISQIHDNDRAGLAPFDARGRGNGPARKAGDPHRACRRPGLRAADEVGVLGSDGDYPDRRLPGRHGAHPPGPTRALRPVVPHHGARARPTHGACCRIGKSFVLQDHDTGECHGAVRGWCATRHGEQQSFG